MSRLIRIFNVKMSYVIIFSSLIAWAFFGYLTMNQLIDSQKKYAKLINISGKQRMLSQKTTLMAKIVFETKKSQDEKHLIDLFNLMKKDHNFMVTNITTDHIRSIYFNTPYDLNKNVKNYFALLETFLEKKDINTLKEIQRYSFELLPKLNHVVYELEKESDKTTENLKTRETYIFIGTVLTLILEALFIMLPTLRILNESKIRLEHFNKKLEAELEKSTNELKETNRLQELYLNSAPALIVALDKNAHVTMINKTGLDLLEYTKDEIVGKNWFDLGVLPKENISIVKEFFFNIIDGKIDPSIEPYENEIISKSGKIYLLQFSNVFFNENGTITGTLSTAINITKQKEQDKLLTEQSKLAAMGEMMGNIAHQWRQPLSVISTGATGMKLQKEYDQLTDEIFNDTCDLIDENAQYLSQTIEDFRNFIKGDKKVIRFDLKNDTDSFLKLVNSSIKNYNIQIILDLEEDIKVQGYPNELIQCFINIFNNSKDELKKIDEDERYIFITQKIEDDHVLINFKDNAGGIPEDIISNIFDPYFTTKHESLGTGLGLSMTYNLITNGMKGTISAKNENFEFNSKKYKGALFTITIPLN